jgi:benzoyl-CoA reductase/2-hydroxyglutaryl-CoA dehydratase subunit BcrC/BadD/HgdB
MLAPLVKDLYVMDMPQMKSESGKMLLKEEYRKLIDKLEKVSGKKVTVESLQKGINIVNAKRDAIRRLTELRAADPAPISGLDALLVNQVFFYDDPVRFTDSVNKLCDELEDCVKKGIGIFPKGTTRVIVSGCPWPSPTGNCPCSSNPSTRSSWAKNRAWANAAPDGSPNPKAKPLTTCWIL